MPALRITVTPEKLSVGGRLFCTPANPSHELRAESREPLFGSPERFPPENPKMGTMP